ncbi:hypothetical protein CYMTET_32667 [Cymbomonas tetramitiformis]|uniref:Macro domain-containing protein n=1 Tax=Cymbomonas tetramitiformis TaxID=36881 RepID=A0AAE0FEE3_9CHLO|nr:hypothetical protein CYMTET_32667 [Cymbomonas tetramitiformis]
MKRVNPVALSSVPLLEDLYLTSGEDEFEAEYAEHGAEEGLCKEIRFPFDSKLNSKVRLYKGVPWALQVDAVVNSTTIHLDQTDEYKALYDGAGPGLQEECAALGGCKTGEARMTNAHNLPASKVIHTVGPRYALRYATAAENALCHAYRSCLEALVEEGLKSLSVGCIHLKSKGYPRNEAAHVAVRTVRRFLEKFGDKVDVIVFAISGPDYSHFAKVLPLYFPRSKAEEDRAQKLLPENTGNESGELVIPERDIRVASGPRGASWSLPG